MEDVRIGRKAYSQETTKLVTAAATPLVGANENRIALIIDNLGPNDVFVSPRGDLAATDSLRIAPGDPPFKLDLPHFGQFITRGLSAVCAAAQTATVVCWETFLEDK